LRYAYLSWCLLVMLAGCNPPAPPPGVPGNGRLQKWSHQAQESPKKIIVVQSKVETEDPNGLTLPQAERFFATKINNLNYLGTELIGMPMFDATELWFYNYYPNQDIAKIATDLETLVSENSHFDNSLIYALGYSQGGVVLWVLDQRCPGRVAGGDVVGAPVLSTPLAQPAVRAEAISAVFPVLGKALNHVFENLTGELSYLELMYPETGRPNGDLQFIAGRIATPPTDVFRRNFNLVDAATSINNFLTGVRDDRQFAELGSYLMQSASWRSGSRDDKTGDGVVPVSSATLDGAVPNVVLEDYDHLDLLSGKGDLVLDRIIAEHIVAVLDLAPKWVVTDLPETPEMIELNDTADSALAWGKFAYINEIDQRMWVADEDWARTFRMPISGEHSWPRFSPDNQSLVFGLADGGRANLYRWHGDWAGPISFDGVSRLADFSPNGQWLAYQADNRLVIHSLTNQRRYPVVSGAELVIPPIWTVENLAGQIYFTHRVSDEAFDIYHVSPRQRDVALSEVECVQTNCRYLFVVRGGPAGIVALSAPQALSDGGREQWITVISGLASTHLSLRVSTSVDNSDGISGQGWADLLLELNHDFDITEIAFDSQYGHLYLNDGGGANPGLYLLDVNLWLLGQPDTWEDVFYRLERAGNISQLDIKTPGR